jgi:hypothetical protein
MKEVWDMNAEVIWSKALEIQVCVPFEWTDQQIIDFSNTEILCGTHTGWHIRKQGDPKLNGSDERVKCEGRDGFVHVMLDA